jgi:hypothetical protein
MAAVALDWRVSGCPSILAIECLWDPTLLGEGIAGWRSLSVLGMICFASAHTVFFLILAQLYSVFRSLLEQS